MQVMVCIIINYASELYHFGTSTPQPIRIGAHQDPLVLALDTASSLAPHLFTPIVTGCGVMRD